MKTRIQFCGWTGNAAVARWVALAAGALTAATGPAAGQSLFTSGDLLVSVYGDVGNAATGSNFTMSLPTPESTYVDGVPTPISLLEFSPTGSMGAPPILTYTLPTTNSGSNFGIVGEYGSSSEGTIQLSADGQYLTVNGYSAAPSIAGVGSPGGLGYYNGNPVSGVALAQATSGNVPRVFAIVDANGNVNSSTIMNNVFSTNNPRSSYLIGTQLYLAGQGSGSSDQGVFLTTPGTNTVANPGTGPTKIYTNTDTRTVQVFSGNLYFSEDKPNKPTGIFEYAGLPGNSTATPVQIIPAGNGSANFSPEGFYFANNTTLYVADTGDPKKGAPGNGGIEKWTLSGSTWTLDYTLIDANFTTDITQAHGETGFGTITGQVVGSDVELFAISYTLGDGDPDGLYAITDDLAAAVLPTGESFTEQEASGANNVFKGVSFAPTAVPEPGICALAAGGLGLVAAARRKRAGR